MKRKLNTLIIIVTLIIINVFSFHLQDVQSNSLNQKDIMSENILQSDPIYPLALNFLGAPDLPEIESTFSTLCREIQVDNTHNRATYTSLKSRLQQWKCRALWELLDTRAAMPEYCNQTACKGKRVLVIGAGPVGLRTAIEAVLLGAEVDVVEKRTNFSRNNVLHLWTFLIDDLRALGAKTFYPSFCVGGINHICIRTLQCMLLKLCLILGVKFHSAVTFIDLVEPKSTGDNWHVCVEPNTSLLQSNSYDAVLSADGKQGTLNGFPSKQFRAKLAIAITANFVRRHTQEDACVSEVGGLSYMYDQAFFKLLSSTHGIDLENVVFFKNEYYYFVMTAKKSSLLSKGVLLENFKEPSALLSRNNIDRTALEQYALDVAKFTTKGEIKNLEYVLNQRGNNDVAIFDFTALYSSENASRILERKGKKLLLGVAGDTLMESFWPTGTGLSRGFLGAFDIAWMFKRFCNDAAPLEIIEEREKIFRLLPTITSPRSLKPITRSYTIDPATRYHSFRLLEPQCNIHNLYDTDEQQLPKHQVDDCTEDST